MLKTSVPGFEKQYFLAKVWEILFNFSSIAANSNILSDWKIPFSFTFPWFYMKFRMWCYKDKSFGLFIGPRSDYSPRMSLTDSQPLETWSNEIVENWMSCPLLTNMQAEAQNLGGRVALPSRKFLRVTPKIAMGSFQTLWKIPDCLDIFWIVRKVSG